MEMLKILQKDYHDAIKNGWVANEIALEKLLDGMHDHATDKYIFDTLEIMIDDCAKKLKKIMGKGTRNLDRDKYANIIFEQQFYNRYVSRYKLDSDRRIDYKTRFETEEVVGRENTKDGRIIFPL